jgi:hypothetical protein
VTVRNKSKRRGPINKMVRVDYSLHARVEALAAADPQFAGMSIPTGRVIVMLLNEIVLAREARLGILRRNDD